MFPVAKETWPPFIFFVPSTSDAVEGESASVVLAEAIIVTGHGVNSLEDFPIFLLFGSL